MRRVEMLTALALFCAIFLIGIGRLLYGMVRAAPRRAPVAQAAQEASGVRSRPPGEPS